MDLVKIIQSFDIGDLRNVHVDVDEDNDVKISVHQDVKNDGGKRKDILFTARLWVRFAQSISIIDNAVQRAIAHEPTTFQLHIGRQWYVGVSDRFIMSTFADGFMHVVLVMMLMIYVQ